MPLLLKFKMDHLNLPSSTSTAFGLRPRKSVSVPSVLPNLENAQNEDISNNIKVNSADSLLLVVVDQVQSWIKLTAGPPNNEINKSDLTFLLDSEGGGGFCFQALNEQEAK